MPRRGLCLALRYHAGASPLSTSASRRSVLSPSNQPLPPFHRAVLTAGRRPPHLEGTRMRRSGCPSATFPKLWNTCCSAATALYHFSQTSGTDPDPRPVNSFFPRATLGRWEVGALSCPAELREASRPDGRSTRGQSRPVRGAPVACRPGGLQPAAPYSVLGLVKVESGSGRTSNESADS